MRRVSLLVAGAPMAACSSSDGSAEPSLAPRLRQPRRRHHRRPRRRDHDRAGAEASLWGEVISEAHLQVRGVVMDNDYGRLLAQMP
ncbi:MAG: hypothetical protein GY698_18080 [Actinomycetia bacterium]|nr:hypothetical protein [Actinomycetes bacterium]